MSRNVKELEEKIGYQFQGQPFAQTCCDAQLLCE